MSGSRDLSWLNGPLLLPLLCPCAHVLLTKEREVELNKLKDDFLTVKKNTGEATDEKNTWATKYEALERNFKQVNERTCGPLPIE